MALSTSDAPKFTLREREDEIAYAHARESGTLPPCRYCVVKNVVKEYEHFLIMQNDFPYSRVAKVHDMLSPKRHVSSLYDLNEAELGELKTIYTELDHCLDPHIPTYDQIIKSTHRNMSIPGHVHLHLIQFRDN